MGGILGLYDGVAPSHRDAILAQRPAEPLVLQDQQCCRDDPFVIICRKGSDDSFAPDAAAVRFLLETTLFFGEDLKSLRPTIHARLIRVARVISTLPRGNVEVPKNRVEFTGSSSLLAANRIRRSAFEWSRSLPDGARAILAGAHRTIAGRRGRISCRLRAIRFLGQ